MLLIHITWFVLIRFFLQLHPSRIEPDLSDEFLHLNLRMLESFTGYFVIGKLWDIMFNSIGMALRFPQKSKNEPDFENCLKYSYWHNLFMAWELQMIPIRRLDFWIESIKIQRAGFNIEQSQEFSFFNIGLKWVSDLKKERLRKKPFKYSSFLNENIQLTI